MANFLLLSDSSKIWLHHAKLAYKQIANKTHTNSKSVAA